ncbi:MAG: glycosyltransferase, partial [Chitinophagaceae bacterium]
MPNLQVIYIAGFNLDGNTGRNNATRQKAEALREVLGAGNFRLYYPKGSSIRPLSYLYALVFDVTLFFKLTGIDKGAVVIERQTIIPLSNVLLRLKKIRMVYELHTDLKSELPFLDKSWIGKKLTWLLIWSERRNLTRSSGIIINSPSLKKLVAPYQKPTLCIYNGANTKDFFPRDQLECRRQLGLNSGYKYFLFSGMASKWHGIELLIQLFKEEALASKPDHVLLIVGLMKDEYSKSLRTLAENCANIQLIDFVPMQAVNTYINAADVCLLPVNNIRTNFSSPLKLY